MPDKTKAEANKSGSSNPVPDWIMERLGELRDIMKGGCDG